MTAPTAVANFRTKLEAETAAGLLVAEGIRYLIQSTEGMGYGPLPPGATLFVLASDAAKAREILDDAGVPVLGDESIEGDEPGGLFESSPPEEEEE